jgi:hypothetical protein
MTWSVCLCSDYTLLIQGRVYSQDDLATLIAAARALAPFLRSRDDPCVPDDGL